MTLDEAIEHCYERTGENRRRAELYVAVKATEKKIQECEECAKEHEQLAKWLEELKEWHIREDMSKNGRCSIIVQGVHLFLTQGHVEALIRYEEEQTTKEALERIFENIDTFCGNTEEADKEMTTPRTVNLCDNCRFADDCNPTLTGRVGARTTKCSKYERTDKEADND